MNTMQSATAKVMSDECLVINAQKRIAQAQPVPHFVIPALAPVIPAQAGIQVQNAKCKMQSVRNVVSQAQPVPQFVIPAQAPVIPAQAGIQVQNAKCKMQSVRNVVSQAQPVPHFVIPTLVPVIPAQAGIMPSRFILLSILILAFASFVCAGPIREGNKLYAKGDYAAALEKYTAARSIEKDSALVRFNIGTALYKNGKFAEAVQELTPLIGMADSSVSAQAAYNAANARFRLGEQAQGGERISAWREALGLLKRALDFDPDYLNAKKNAEIISRRLKAEIAQQKNQKKDGEDGKQPPLSEAAKRAKERALQLTREGRYAEAKAVLEKALQAEPEATALSPYIQRLTDVLDITAGKKPLAPPDASNAVNELEVI